MKPRKVQLKTKPTDLENGKNGHSKQQGLTVIRIYFLISSLILYGFFHIQKTDGRNYCLWCTQHSMVRVIYKENLSLRGTL